MLTTRSAPPSVAALSSFRGTPPTRRNTRAYFRYGPLSRRPQLTAAPAGRAVAQRQAGAKAADPGAWPSLARTSPLLAHTSLPRPALPQLRPRFDPAAPTSPR